MRNNRYQDHDFYAYIILSLNIMSLITYWIGHRYRQIWVNIKLGDRSIKTKIPLSAGIDCFFIFKVVLLLASPIPGYDKIYTTQKALNWEPS